ncbi:hypothetical protein F9B74_07545 [Pelistega sp. NLN82]|uniref:PIN domain-containing protein n=1 Tax=Pelistega ratti TaxID=2652177 RepID=A0A6L9Y8W2_9BURK|nr:hypothetical protein [Pelistega ratti]NEN76174.1 hypothetical protein [Pelistega ratti]
MRTLPILLDINDSSHEQPLSSSTSYAINTLITLDTCVLMHSFTRNLLLRLGKYHLCFPIWSQEIGIEWLRNAPRIWKVSPNIVEKEWDNMQIQYPLSNMGEVPIYENLFKRIDKKDRHVAYCALEGIHRFNPQESILLTWNIKDFHRKELHLQEISLKTPDEYLSTLWKTHTQVLTQLFLIGREEHLRLGLPDYTIPELLKRDKLYRLAKLAAQPQI